MTLPLTIDRLADGEVRLRAVGDIDVDNAPLLRDAVTSILATARPERIVVDLDAVSFIDSVGVGVLVSCFHAAAACGTPLRLANPSPVVHRQLWVCGLVGLFDLPTPASARCYAVPAPDAGPAGEARPGEVRPGEVGRPVRP